MKIITKSATLARFTLSVLLAVCAASAWATNGTLQGNGSTDTPYTISDVADWNALAAFIAENNSNYAGADKHFQLDPLFDNANNPITTPIGDIDHPFQGYFNGNGRTLTVNINNTSDVQGAAPIRKINGATIENVKVATTPSWTATSAPMSAHPSAAASWGTAAATRLPW